AALPLLLLVDVGASGLEQQVGLLAAGLDRVEQFVGTTGHADQSLVRGPLHPLGLRVDADHPPGLDVLAALELVHQVGTDVAGSHDRGGELGLLRHTCESRHLSTPPQSRVPFTGTATPGRYAGGLVREPSSASSRSTGAFQAAWRIWSRGGARGAVGGQVCWG